MEPSSHATNTWTASHGGWVRGDVSQVPALGAYAARQCPVRAQWDVLHPAEPQPVPEFMAALGRDGVAFEADVYGQLAALHPGTIKVDEDMPLDERERLTVEAIAHGAPLVLGGRLPVDDDGRRVAHPDVLVRAATDDGRWRYLPVDVKHHGTLTDEGKGTDVAVQAMDELRTPTGANELLPSGRRDNKARKDLLQLAHYWRTLDAHGLAPDGPAWGGVLGSEQRIAWYRLDLPLWRTPSASSDSGTRMRSTLDVYDFEFGFRLDIVATALAHKHDPDVALLVDPVWIDECSNCPWRAHCRDQLEARQDVSLLPRVRWPAWSTLRRADVTTIPELAALPDDTAVKGLGSPALTNAIDEARARIGPDLAYRRRGVDQLMVPRADVEVDVDMENVADGAYLWGCLVTDRTHAGLVEEGYHPFVSWNPDSEAAGIEAFLVFWEWLGRVRDRCRQASRSMAAYCWHAPAENRWLARSASHTGFVEGVEAFTSSAMWIDLRRVFNDQVITGYAAGLKDVATLLGFRWRDSSPGGDVSMLWWQDAVDPTTSSEQRAEVRQRLLGYNEDDVRATLHVRSWMEAHAATLHTVRRP